MEEAGMILSRLVDEKVAAAEEQDQLVEDRGVEEA